MKFLKLHLYQETNFNDHSLIYFKMGNNLADWCPWIRKDPCVKGLVSRLIDLLGDDRNFRRWNFEGSRYLRPVGLTLSVTLKTTV